MFSFINESLTLQQIMVTLIIFAIYLLFRGRWLWNFDMEACFEKKGLVLDIAINVIGGAYWIYCFFVDWKTTLVMMVALSIVSSFLSYTILRQRLIYLSQTQE